MYPPRPIRPIGPHGGVRQAMQNVMGVACCATFGTIIRKHMSVHAGRSTAGFEPASSAPSFLFGIFDGRKRGAVMMLQASA